MAEHSGEQEAGRGDVPVAVIIDAETLGQQYTREGSTFSLSDLVGRGRQMLGADRFTKVYIRTASGNIYMLNEQGHLYNANECKRAGQLVSTPLPRDELAERSLVVGEPFIFGTGGKTTEISEIVASPSRRYSNIEALSGGRVSTIRKDFIDMLPDTPGADGQRKPRVDLPQAPQKHTPASPIPQPRSLRELANMPVKSSNK
jgi:hypothetical protein